MSAPAACKAEFKIFRIGEGTPGKDGTLFPGALVAAKNTVIDTPGNVS
jgi:hypothetical protein